MGEISYNEDGTIDFRQVLLQYQAEGNEVIWPTEQATADAVTPLR